MKKLLLTFILFLIPLTCFAEETIYLQDDKSPLAPDTSELEEFSQEDDTIFKGKVETEPEQIQIPDISVPQPIVTEHSKFYEGIKKIADDVYSLEIENTRIPSALLNDTLTFRPQKGPVEKVHLWAVTQMNFGTTIPEDGNVSNTFKVGLVNVLLDGKFRGGKERFRIMLDATPQNVRPTIQNLFQDMYISTDRIPHHRILVGNSRPSVGYEGSASSYTLPFINRSQISRHFGTVRKTGIRVMGNYKYIDYDLGGFSSDTYFTEFFPGAEFDGWVNFKPLANVKDNKYGELKIGGGIVAGSRNSTRFFVSSAYIGYRYKRFYIKAEYANSDGSNGSTGLTSKQRQGWYVSLGYKITKKLEAVLRYDEFDNDKNISNNNTREYSAGINYYIKGQALKLILNYVFCQNQAGQDSHRIMIGTQIAI